MSEPDDHQLLAQFARENSEAAFAALVQRHVNLVYSVAHRHTGNDHAAEEITQAVFIILAQKAGCISSKIILSGWLYQTTRLTAANFLRGEIRRQKREQEAYMRSTLNQPETGAWPQIAPLPDDALARLGERDRNAIVLRFFENKSLREVGHALGAGEDAAKMRVNRALEKLRRIFSKGGVTLSATVIASAVAANSVQAAPAGLTKTISAVAVAKGATATTSTLALVKGTSKLMSGTKVKTAIVACAGIALLLGGGIITFGIDGNDAGEKLTTREILLKVQTSYDALSTYSSSGKSVTENPGRSLTNMFAVKFARPDRYIVRGTQAVGRVTHTMVVWPADGQVFMLADQARYFRVAEDKDEDFLKGSTGNGVASGLSVAGLFFHKKWDVSIELLAANTNVVRQSDEKVAGVNCYVLTTTMTAWPYKITLWIGQKDFLIRQRRILTQPQPPNPQDASTFTETHVDVVVNAAFSMTDLTPQIPAGVKLEAKPLR